MTRQGSPRKPREKMILTLAFKGRKKFDNFILFQNSWYSLIDSSIRFDIGVKVSTSLGRETPLKVYGNLKRAL